MSYVETFEELPDGRWRVWWQWGGYGICCTFPKRPGKRAIKSLRKEFQKDYELFQTVNA